MAETSRSISVPGAGAISVLRAAPSRPGRWTFVYAPGAGASLRDPFGAFAARELTARGVAIVRFQFPYMESGRKSPDRPPVLEATWRAVIDAVRSEMKPGGRLCAGGRSMGGRIASQVVAQGVDVDALALFAYPLHPPGKPDQPRVEHLPRIKAPTLFVSGTRDAFGSPEELRAAAKKMRRARLHLLNAADHAFAVPKSSGRTRDSVYAEAVGVLAAWLHGL
jgi:predicted alpha/beta-hydrolase family hydrolase